MSSRKPLSTLRAIVISLVVTLVLNPTTAISSQLSLEEGFDHPPREARPLGWWHWINGNVTKEGIKADLEAAKKAGMGGVQMFDAEIYMPPGPVRYGSDLWHEHVQYAIQIADQLGLEFHLMNTPGWSASGGPWVTAELSMKQLVWSETETWGGEVSLHVPKSKTGPPSKPRHPVDLNFYQDIAVIAVPQTTERLDHLQSKVGAAAKPVSRSIDPEVDSVDGIPLHQVLDLTEGMTADGMLTTILPPGDWVILRFGFTSTGRGNHPAVPEGTGLEIDKLDADAVAFQFERAIGRIVREAGPRAGTTFNGLLFDSFEAGFQTWTAKMPKQFSTIKGYDLIPYLPVMTGRIIESRQISEAVLWDFRHVTEELVAENYFGTMHRLAAKHGIKIYSESQGGLLNPMSANRYVDVPMNEFWMPDATPRAARIKQTVSSASLAGKTLVAAEAFTATPENGKYQNSPSRLKRPGDQAFALGINRFNFHSYTHQPVTEAAPGFALGRYGTHFGRLNTWWPYADGWIDYLSRTQFLLQRGRIQADVCFMIDENLGYGLPSEMTTMLPGYDFELCYPPAVREMSVSDGVLQHPSGAEYQLLVTPQEWLAETWVAELSTLRHIRDLVRAGATLVGEPPTAPAGLNDMKHAQEFVRLVEEIWSNSDKPGARFHQVGAGWVYQHVSPLDVLRARKVTPDLAWSPADASIQFIHRQAADADIYFVFNDSANPVQAHLEFRQSDRRPEIWDALTGKHDNAPVFVKNKNTIEVPVRLPAWGSTFVIFRKPLPERWITATSPSDLEWSSVVPLTRSDSLAVYYSDATQKIYEFEHPSETQSLTGPWQVNFIDGRGAPKQASLPQLTSWTERPHAGIRYYSGTAVYQAEFEVTPHRQGQVAMLDLGRVADIARLFINGQEVRVLWTPPFRTNITDYVQPGENSLTVHVANRWINRLIGDEAIPVDYVYQERGGSKFTDGRIMKFPRWLRDPAQRDESKRHSFSIWKHYDVDSPLVESGLLGPVDIEWLWPLDLEGGKRS